MISLKLFSRFKEILLGWSEVKKDKRLMLNLLFITVIGNIIASVILLLELKMIGIETDFFFAMFLTMIISFALPFSVLPGNLGIKEIFVIFSFGIVGISASQSIIISIIDRLVSLVILVLLFLIVQLVLKNDKSVQALFKMNSNLASNNLPNKGT